MNAITQAWKWWWTTRGKWGEGILKCVALLSGGIDSAVSTALALEKGVKVFAVHLDNYPFSDRKNEEKSRKILETLAKKFGKKIEFIVIPNGESQKGIIKNCSRKLNCVLCRRMMLKKADALREKEGADFLVTGESLGQVASQTLSNLRTEFNATRAPVLKPLLGMDKTEIESLARSYGTFETSIQRAGCCSLVPEKPATKSSEKEVEEEEKKLETGKLVEESLKKSRREEIG